MEALGTIVEIVGSSMVLVKAERHFNVDEVLKVFAEVEATELQTKHGLRVLHVPKGELRVLAKQAEGFFLAEAFRPTVESSRVVERPNSLLAGILSHEVVKETVPGPPSAQLSKPTVEFEMTKRVQVGDKVGRE
jgi:hypothetical protein